MTRKNYPEEKARYDTRSEEAGSKAKILDRVAKAAYDNNRAYEGCARCVLHALQTHLNITDSQSFTAAFKASTALSAGVARKGETCGALLGGLLALGLETGTVNLHDFSGYVDTMSVASSVFDRFKEKYGTVKCFEIQENCLGVVLISSRMRMLNGGTRMMDWTSAPVYALLLLESRQKR